MAPLAQDDLVNFHRFHISIFVGLFNTVINVVLLISMNAIVKKMNDGKGV